MIRYYLKPRLLYLLVDFVLISAACAISYYSKFIYRFPAGTVIDYSHANEYLFSFILWGFFIIIVLHIKKLYTTDRGLSVAQELMRVFSALFYASTVVGAVVFFAKYKFFSRELFLITFILLFAFLGSFRVIKRLILRRLIRKGFHNINVLVVGANKVGKHITDKIKSLPSWGFRVVGFLDDEAGKTFAGLPVIGKISDFSTVVKQYFIDEIIIATPERGDVIAKLIQETKHLRVGVRLFPGEVNGEIPYFSITYLGLLPLVNYSEKKYYLSRFIIKRMLDLAGTMLLLIVLWPFLLAIAIAIKLDSPGPIFYVRPRIGVKGKIFSFYKFRSMVKDADLRKECLIEKNEIRGGVIFKIKQDPRITKIGRFMRRYSLDELPQLINVLRGDMSLVGPRPFPVEETRNFQFKHMPRLNMRPGITGLPQVKGRSDLSFEQWVKWDLWYINNWSFSLDLQILLWTIPAVLKGKGAY